MKLRLAPSGANLMAGLLPLLTLGDPIRTQDGNEVNGMPFQFFSTMFRNRQQQFRLFLTVLTISSGPVLAQERTDDFIQPAIAARSAVLMNPATGEILFAKEPHLRLPPASTTKVLTALVVLEHLDPNTRLSVSPQAASASPSRIGLRAGETAAAQDLLYGLLLKSGNDAAETLAEGAGGSINGFAELMNARAGQIGAHESHFMNPHGLPNDDHFTTAYDLALIFRQAMNHPMFADIVRTRSAALRIESGQGAFDDWRMVPVNNHNRLLASYEGARGGKTGFTLKARRCFVGEVDRGGVRLIVAILNSPNSGTLWQDARTLLDYGFARYGLAPPPPVQPESLPVLVRHNPVITPAVARIAAKPLAVRPVATAKPKAIARTAAVAKPAVSAKAKAFAKTGAAKANKPLAVNTARPSTGKITKAEKRESPKVARAETAVKPSPKIAKPRS
jgi:D-alanyl-D-alanine carboxypeptidase (penicillin-binding protein 5/6)